MNKFLNRKINRVNGHRLAFLLIIILGLVSVYLNLEKNELERTLNNTYSMAFCELVEFVDNVETLLA